MKTYREIGEKAGLTGDRLEMYIAYISEAWPITERYKCSTGYAQEWAERFHAGREWEYSDAKGKSILQRLYNQDYREA